MSSASRNLPKQVPSQGKLCFLQQGDPITKRGLIQEAQVSFLFFLPKSPLSHLEMSLDYFELGQVLSLAGPGLPGS